MKKVLVTGSKGFVGANLIRELNQMKDISILEFHKGSERAKLEVMLNEADFVFHLAGVNRPLHTDEFRTGNFELTKEIASVLERKNQRTGLIFSSSIQALNDSPYGHSKKQAEDSLLALKDPVRVYCYRLPNVFGEGCRPNYNSAVATFCHNLTQNLPIIIHDENAKVKLVYVKDVVADFIAVMNSFLNDRADKSEFRLVQPVQEVTIGHVAEALSAFKGKTKFQKILTANDQNFYRKLESTFNSYRVEAKG